MQMAAHCGLSLRIIEAQVNDDSFEAIKRICQACTNLTLLDLYYFNDEVSDDFILAPIQYCPLVEVLPTRSIRLTDATLNGMASIHTLKQLRISGDFESAAVQRALQSNPGLTLISIDKTDNIDDALVGCVGRYCGSLTSLKLLGEQSLTLNNETLLMLFHGCPLLESLELYLQGGVSNVALRALFESCHNLQVLLLCKGDSNPTAVQSLTSEPVLTAPYPSLAQLRIISDGTIDNQAFRDIFTYCLNLEGVDLRRGIQVTDKLIKLLVSNCRKIEFLNLALCLNVTVTGILQLATRCTSLTTLNLFVMPMNDEILIQLSLTCRKLIRLNIFNCYGGRITEAGIRAIAEACTSLSCFNLGGTTAATLDPTLDVAKLERLYPRIRFDIRR